MENLEKMLKNKIVKNIGYVGVDAGMIMIGDPCYVIHNDDEEFKKKIYGKDWHEFCDKVIENEHQSLQLPMGIGFCTPTVEGDGFYNIYGIYDDEHEVQPKMLIVEL